MSFFRSIPIKASTECIIKAFPLYLRNDVRQICKSISVSERFHYDDSTEWLLSSGEVITMPYRIVFDDEFVGDLGALTPAQKTIYHCIMSRDSDGYVREEHIKELLKTDLPEWAMPYVIKLCDEYVVEILQTVYDSLSRRDCSKYKEICALNFEYIKRAHTRMISYWNEFYRWDCYRYENYIGKKLYRDCFGYGKTGQKSIRFAEYQKARIYFNRKPVRLLDTGTYYFWNNGIRIDVDYVDTRLTQMNVTGQEILTADKVSIRVNLVVNYRVADYEKIFTDVNDYVEQIHVAAQLALREYVGRYKLDEILERKDEMSNFIFDKLKAKEGDFFVEIKEAGVKDIILPGEIRDIMNTVLIAEKRAQANVITRREEVASTRSLLNTAKMMDENKTLYKLKELEFVERICENVGNINLGGNGDIVTQLVGLLSTK